MTGYRKGANFENLVKDILDEDDWMAIRSAGSHTILDLIAVKYGQIWFIQCRTAGNLSGKEREELVVLAEKHKAVPILAYKSKGDVVFEEIKSKVPTFHLEIINGKFTRIDN